MTLRKIGGGDEPPRLLYLETEDWAFCQHRINLARAARMAGFRVGLVAPAGNRVEEIRGEGFEFFPLRLRRTGTNPFQEASSIAEIRGIYRRERPDIVHNVALKSVLYGTLAARFAGVPAVVNSLTGLGYTFIGNSLRRTALRTVISTALRFTLRGNKVRCVFQNPDDLALFTSRRLVESSKSLIIRGSGVDTERFQPGPEPPGPPIVLLASRLLWDKGIGDLVEAARILRKDGLSFRLVLAGDPDLANPANIPSDILSSWRKEGIAEVPGYIRDMVGILSKSHVACLPSYREGLPLFLLEAAASGKPCLTTDVPGCREVVRHGENGFIVPIRDVVALAAALRKLILDSELRHRMGEKGRQIAVTEFSKEQVGSLFLDLYKRLLSSQNKIPLPLKAPLGK